MSDSLSPHPELLLDQVAWIRRLAGTLVRDELARDDLVQETWVRALERPPATVSDAGGLRRWLATVMRNLVRQDVRGSGRRRDREDVVRTADEDEPTSGVVRRVTAQRELVHTVLELDEPYRTALLLRYFEDLPPREIARELDVPVSTVHSRLKRALAQLREALDRSHGGDRSAWLAMFVPLVDPGTPPALAPTLGALIVNAKVLAVVAVLLVAGTVFTVVQSPDESEPVLGAVTEEAVRAPDERAAAPSEFDGVEVVAADAAREAVAPTVPAPTSGAFLEEEAAPEPRRFVRGQVLDASGAPLAGIPVHLEDEIEVAVSGPGGVFELEVARSEGRLRAASAEWVTVREGVHREGAFEPVVVVAPRVDLAGEVVSKSGQPLAGAQIGFELPRGFDTRFSRALEATRSPSWTTTADAWGRFELEGVPGLDGGLLRAVLDGYAMAERDAPTHSDRGILIVLERPTKPVEGSLSGRVVDPQGSPLEGARVATGLVSAVTDEEGLFHLDLTRAVTPDRLVAVREGFLPAEMDRPMSPDSGNAGWPEFVELELDGPPHSLHARLVDEEGEPIAGAQVWVADGTRFGTIGRMPTTLENLMAGAFIPPQALESIPDLPDEDGESVWAQATSGAPPTALWNYVTTDSTGEFRFHGLLERPYRIGVLDPETLQLFTSDPVAPGPGVQTIEVPSPDVFEVVSGVVRDERGRPLEGVDVSLFATPFHASSRVFGGTSRVSMTAYRESVRTDSNGEFVFEDVPREGIQLFLLSGFTVPANRDLADHGDEPVGITVEVETRCQVAIELEDPTLADHYRFYDADDESLQVLILSEGSQTSSSHGQLVDGRSGVVSVSGKARSVHLLANGELVDVVPIDLVPTEINYVIR